MVENFLISIMISINSFDVSVFFFFCWNSYHIHVATFFLTMIMIITFFNEYLLQSSSLILFYGEKFYEKVVCRIMNFKQFFFRHKLTSLLLSSGSFCLAGHFVKIMVIIITMNNQEKKTDEIRERKKKY